MMTVNFERVAGVIAALLLCAAAAHLPGCATTGEKGISGDKPPRHVALWPDRIKPGRERYPVVAIRPGERALIFGQTMEPSARGEYGLRVDVQVPRDYRVLSVKRERDGKWDRLLWGSEAQGMPGDYNQLYELTSASPPASHRPALDGVAVYLTFTRPLLAEQHVRLLLAVRTAGGDVRFLTRSVTLVPLPQPRLE